MTLTNLRRSTHDGASNMLKCSRLLEVDGVIHCIAHSIHHLLTVDSINKIADLVDLLKKCKQIVTSLHFKGYILCDELKSLKIEDRQIMDTLLDKIEKAREELNLNERFSDGTDVGDVTGSRTSYTDVSDAEPDPGSAESKPHHHHTLKQEIPTR